MGKKFFILVIVTLFICSTVGAFAAESLNEPTIKPMEKTKDRASRAMNNILYGPVEIPQNLNDTNTKGTAMDKCSTKTRSGVERGIARTVAGVWQLATFWYSDPGCVTSASQAGRTAAAETAPVTVPNVK